MVAKSPEGIGANVKIFLGHFQKCLTALFFFFTIPSLTVYKKGKRLKASYFKAFSHFSFCFELCYILSCVIFVVLFL